jgi:hypothetical protein
VLANTAYVLDEVGLTGYNFVSIGAGVGDSAKCPIVLGGEVTLVEGENVTCTIANDDVAPQLTLIKNVTNDNGGIAQSEEFNLTVGGNPVLSGESNLYAANTPLAINETLLTSYAFVDITGDPKCPAVLGGEITLDEGDDITCTLNNDDISVDFETAAQSVDEGSGSTLVTVQLSGPSTIDITIPFSISGTAIDGTDFTISPNPPEQLTILAGEEFGNILISLIDNPVHEPTKDSTIILTLETPIINAYLGTDIVHTVTILDDDIPGITVAPTDISTSEGGLPAKFTVILDTQPLDDVNIELRSSDELEGTIDESSLTFSDVTWDIPQTVTVIGVDDFIHQDPGNPDTFTIIIDPATSSDLSYAGIDPQDVNVINLDNDTPGLAFSPTTGLWTSEGEKFQDVQIILQTKPKNDVTLYISSLNEDEGIVSPIQIIAKSDEWTPDKSYAFTITGVDDTEPDGDTNYEVKVETSSIDDDYEGLLEELDIINYGSPTIEWIYPVGDEEVYEVENNLGLIRLEVQIVSSEPISKVRFYRWVEGINDHVTIGEDLFPPYEGFLDLSDIEFGWNQVFAFAFGPKPSGPTEKQTYSVHKRILFYRVQNTNPLIFMPIINK